MWAAAQSSQQGCGWALGIGEPGHGSHQSAQCFASASLSIAASFPSCLAAPLFLFPSPPTLMVKKMVPLAASRYKQATDHMGISKPQFRVPGRDSDGPASAHV